MTNIKPLDQSGNKWMNRAIGASGDYTNGVNNPRTPWDQGALKAADNYKSGVTAAAGAGRFEKGIKAAGNSKWQTNALRKGPGRFSEGVSLGQSDWQAGFAPYQQAISGLTLPPRGMRGSPANLQRVNAVATALRQTFEKKQ